jgi:ABC-type Fe3+ transport system permease subunit
VWVIHGVSTYLLVPYSCASHSAALAMHAVSIMALIVLVLLAVSARRRYKRASLVSKDSEVDDWPPERWAPAGCFILSSAFFFVILAQTIPAFIVEQCQ